MRINNISIIKLIICFIVSLLLKKERVRMRIIKKHTESNFMTQYAL